MIIRCNLLEDDSNRLSFFYFTFFADLVYNYVNCDKIYLVSRMRGEVNLNNFQKAIFLLQNIDKIKQLNGKGMTLTEFSKITDVSRPTLYKYIQHPETMSSSFVNKAAMLYDKVVKFQDILDTVQHEDKQFKTARQELIKLLESNVANIEVSDYTRAIATVIISDLKEENSSLLKALSKQLPFKPNLNDNLSK